MNALKERYRKAYSIAEGYEIRTVEGQWLLVAAELRIYAPLNVVILTTTDGSRFTFAANEEVMSRRPGSTP